tara:strand:+ start:118140 stop:118319 length:180 start_codon:yes stop_codon:yes gene_type:complete
MLNVNKMYALFINLLYKKSLRYPYQFTQRYPFATDCIMAMVTTEINNQAINNNQNISYT